MKTEYKPIKIFCTNKEKIVYGSKVKIMAFDKTGTLT